jgi:Phage integrase family
MRRPRLLGVASSDKRFEHIGSALPNRAGASLVAFANQTDRGRAAAGDGVNRQVRSFLHARRCCRGTRGLGLQPHYYERSGTRWLRFQEKRGKEHEVPVHSKAKEAVDLWLERSHLASNPSAPLFPSFGKNRETVEQRHLDRRSVLKLVEKRARTSGILKRVCCHSFRATGVTEYMNSGGTIRDRSADRRTYQSSDHQDL